MDDPSSFFRGYRRAAVAVSGGVDSTVVLEMAVSAGVDVVAVFVETQLSHPGDEDAVRAVCGPIGVIPEVVRLDVLSIPEVRANGPDRCYYCKRAIFSVVAEMHPDRTVMDGTNASDDADGRPGFRALAELGVVSPLRAMGMTKEDVRRYARSVGLSNWNRPSESCVATRIPVGIPLEQADMDRVRFAEGVLTRMGYSGFRVHVCGDVAELWLDGSQIPRAESELDVITLELTSMFSEVRLAGVRINH
ncbi:MAG: ATP-dependent sacrificial sulfur transferase LarE [Candidatus Methanomethylophilaceae archaeon]|nr:ATP-dependent sacrificial sulfur transferase LarE [Candidatus Methanomethylophilaceae archaeon]